VAVRLSWNYSRWTDPSNPPDWRRYNCPVSDSADPGAPGHATLTLDTPADIGRLQVDGWRRMTPLEKMQTVSALSHDAQELALAGIRMRHPEASERECQLRLAEIKIGREFTARLYPEARTLLGP